MERVPGMLLDRQVEARVAQVERPAVDRDEEALRRSGAGHLSVAVEEVRSIAGRQLADRAAQVLHERQLGQADLVIDPSSRPGLERRLDRPIDPRIGYIVGRRRRARAGSAARSRSIRRIAIRAIASASVELFQRPGDDVDHQVLAQRLGEDR